MGKPQIDRNKQQAGQKLDTKITPGNRLLAAPASSPERQKADQRHQVQRLQLPPALRAVRVLRTDQRPSNRQTVDDDVEKAADRDAVEKAHGRPECGWHRWHRFLRLPGNFSNLPYSPLP